MQASCGTPHVTSSLCSVSNQNENDRGKQGDKEGGWKEVRKEDHGHVCVLGASSLFPGLHPSIPHFLLSPFSARIRLPRPIPLLRPSIAITDLTEGRRKTGKFVQDFIHSVARPVSPVSNTNLFMLNSKLTAKSRWIGLNLICARTSSRVL